MIDVFCYIALIVLGYLIGSISNSILLAKALHFKDPRTMGSKNPGATNMIRLAGKKWGVIVLLLDVLKGMIPVMVVCLIGVPAWVIAATSGAAFLGHLYPVYFRFKGGKGIAVTIGIMGVLSWPILLCFLVVWLVVLLVSRYVALASVCAAIVLPGLVYYWPLVHSNYFRPLPWPSYFTLAFVMMILIVWRHRSNGRRIMEGKEPQVF